MNFALQALRSVVIGVLLPAALSLGAAGVLFAAESGGLPLPAPGTYNLDRIQRAPFSLVREGSGFPHLLSSFTTGNITLLGFFYGQCSDPKGCPLAWGAFEIVRERIKADPALHGQVRLVFFSFDPLHDTPQTLELFANRYKADAEIVPWHFITSWSDVFLRSTLQSFGQEISAQTDTLGEKRVVIDHLLKVFLIDREGWVREIYTSAFLNPDVLIGDIQTLLLEESKSNLAN
jgi:cytochrome oxidase Cu insertion factor (SCO1/SenC/PrrC family)